MKIKSLLDSVENFEIIYYGDMEKTIKEVNISRGYLDILSKGKESIHSRIEVFGKTEIKMLKRTENIKYICNKETPCLVFCHGEKIEDDILKIAKENRVTIMQTDIQATIICNYLYNLIASAINETISLHGVLMNIFSIGTIIQGKSGIGKSEIALELISKQHQLISDDRVIVQEIYTGKLIGKSPEITKNLLELRGIGVVDVGDIFGHYTTEKQTEIDLIIELVPYNKNFAYERLGSNKNFTVLFNTKVPKFIIPVKSGRNTTLIVETAVKNFILQKKSLKSGYQKLVENLERG